MDDAAMTVLDAVKGLIGEIAAGAAGYEAAGTLPTDLVDRLEAAGVLRMAVPAAVGGLELSMPDMNAVITELAAADGSVGWIAMVASQVPWMTLRLSETGYRYLYADGPHCRHRFVGAPSGTAIAVDGGFVVSGSWSFASGMPGTTHVIVANVVIENGAPRMTAFGLPDLLLTALPFTAVTYTGTWNTLGMRATDSGTVTATEVFVPADHSGYLFAAGNCLGVSIGRIPFTVAVQPGHAAMALGVAKGALNDIVATAPVKRPTYNPMQTIAEDPVVQHKLGQALMAYEAVEAFVDRTTREIWRTAVEGREPTVEERLRYRSLGAYVTTECARIVDVAYTLGGGSALHESGSLPRRLRDMHTLTQHVSVFEDPYRFLAAATVGAELPPIALAF